LAQIPCWEVGNNTACQEIIQLSWYPNCKINRSKALLEKPIVAQLVKKLPAFYWTRRFIAVFTRSRHWSLSWTRWIQSTTSGHISLRSISTLSSLRIGLPIAYLFQVSPPPQTLYLCLIAFQACYLPYPSSSSSSSPLLNHSNSTNSTNYEALRCTAFYQKPVTSFLLSSYILSCSSIIGWGTMLRAGSLQVPFPVSSLHFSIDWILKTALRPWDRLRL
jgi:hypothetical protein